MNIEMNNIRNEKSDIAARTKESRGPLGHGLETQSPQNCKIKKKKMTFIVDTTYQA